MLSPETRQKLADKLNKYIDIPLVNERHEQFLAEKVVDMCVSNFAEDDQEIEDLKRKLKSKMVEKLNEKIDIPFANERMEARILGKIADFLLKDTFDAQADRDDD